MFFARAHYSLIFGNDLVEVSNFHTWKYVMYGVLQWTSVNLSFFFRMLLDCFFCTVLMVCLSVHVWLEFNPRDAQKINHSLRQMCLTSDFFHHVP